MFPQCVSQNLSNGKDFLLLKTASYELDSDMCAIVEFWIICFVSNISRYLSYPSSMFFLVLCLHASHFLLEQEMEM